MHTNPTCTIIQRDGRDTVRIRLAGGSITPNWRESLDKRAARGDDDTALCVMVVTHDEHGWHVRSYGGTVWPTAWPWLFEGLRPTVAEGGGRIRVTEEGAYFLNTTLHDLIPGRTDGASLNCPY